ncbi:MAG: hypothetical protein R3E66_09215 [bacterium]
MKFVMILLLMVVGCVPGDPTFNVTVCGDVEIPGDVDAYRIVIYDADLNDEVVSGGEDLVTCPGDVVRSLPRRSEFTAVAGETWVRVQGLKQGVVRTTFDRRVRAEDGEDVSIRVGMTRACWGSIAPKAKHALTGHVRPQSSIPMGRCAQRCASSSSPGCG